MSPAGSLVSGAKMFLSNGHPRFSRATALTGCSFPRAHLQAVIIKKSSVQLHLGSKCDIRIPERCITPKSITERLSWSIPVSSDI